MNVFDRLPPIQVEVELTTVEQDYLREMAQTTTGSLPWTSMPGPEHTIMAKLMTSLSAHYRKELGLDA